MHKRHLLWIVPLAILVFAFFPTCLLTKRQSGNILSLAIGRVPTRRQPSEE